MNLANSWFRRKAAERRALRHLEDRQRHDDSTRMQESPDAR